MLFESQSEVQKAMYALLMPFNNLDSILASLGCTAVYDWKNVPQNAPFDYIVFGDGYELPDDTFDSNGFKLYTMVHLLSNQNNSKNPQLMLSRLNQLFHRVKFSLDTLGNVSSLHQRTTMTLDSAGIIPVLHYAIQYLSYSVQ